MAHDLEACRVRIHLPSGLSFRAEGVRVFEQSSDDGRQRRIAVGIVTSANTAHVLTFPAHAVSSDGLWLPKRKSTLSFDESGKGSSLGRSMSSLLMCRRKVTRRRASAGAHLRNQSVPPLG